jgi:hypothetical protein
MYLYLGIGLSMRYNWKVTDNSEGIVFMLLFFCVFPSKHGPTYFV